MTNDAVKLKISFKYLRLRISVWKINDVNGHFTIEVSEQSLVLNLCCDCDQFLSLKYAECSQN